MGGLTIRNTRQEPRTRKATKSATVWWKGHGLWHWTGRIQIQVCRLLQLVNKTLHLKSPVPQAVKGASKSSATQDCFRDSASGSLAVGLISACPHSKTSKAELCQLSFSEYISPCRSPVLPTLNSWPDESLAEESVSQRIKMEELSGRKTAHVQKKEQRAVMDGDQWGGQVV